MSDETVWVSTSSSTVYHADKDCLHAGESMSRRDTSTMEAWGYTACSYCHGGSPASEGGKESRGGGISDLERAIRREEQA